MDEWYAPYDIDLVEFNKYLDMYWAVYSYDPTEENPEEILLEEIPVKKCEI